MSRIILGTKEAIILQFLNFITESDDDFIITYKNDDKARLLINSFEAREQLFSKDTTLTEQEILNAIKVMEYVVVPSHLLNDYSRGVADNSKKVLEDYLDANAELKKAYHKFMDVVQEMKKRR